MSTSIVEIEALVKQVAFSKSALRVALADGRQVLIPLDWIPGLRDASARQRKDWELIAGGVGIHWIELDEDVMVEDLLALGKPALPLTRSTARARRTIRKSIRRSPVRG